MIGDFHNHPDLRLQEIFYALSLWDLSRIPHTVSTIHPRKLSSENLTMPTKYGDANVFFTSLLGKWCVSLCFKSTNYRTFLLDIQISDTSYSNSWKEPHNNWAMNLRKTLQVFTKDLKVPQTPSVTDSSSQIGNPSKFRNTVTFKRKIQVALKHHWQKLSIENS